MIRSRSKKAAEHHVVIVGGGFAGLYAAQSLPRSGLRVTLIDRNNFHLFQPLLYQVATGGLSPADIATPLRSLFGRRKHVRVLQGEVTGLSDDDEPLSRTLPMGRHGERVGRPVAEIRA